MWFKFNSEDEGWINLNEVHSIFHKQEESEYWITYFVKNDPEEYIIQYDNKFKRDEDYHKLSEILKTK